MPDLRSNLWKYAVVLVANKRVFVAILSAYYLTIPNVTVRWIGLLLGIGNIAGFIFEIPSGYLADKIGHKKVLVMARVAMILSTLFFLFAGNIWFLILGSVFLSLSAAFHSGTGTAFMHETMRGLNRESEYSQVMGKISSIGFAVPIIFMVWVPFLVGISYKLPFVVALVTDIIGLLAALALVNPPVTPEHVKEVGVTNFRQVLGEGYHLNFFRYSLFMGVISGILLAIGGFRAPYQAAVGLPVIWFGVLFGAGRVIASLLIAYSGKLHKLLGTISSFFGFQLGLFSVLILALALISQRWVVGGVFILINGFQWGLGQVSAGYLLNVIRESKFKATLLSVDAQIDGIVGAVASFGLGWAIQRFSYQSAFLYTGIILIAILVPFYAYILRSRASHPTL